jgi:NAD-dependent SIR2 family protein deacetylase
MSSSWYCPKCESYTLPQRCHSRVSSLSKRERRGDVNTIEDAVRLIRDAKHIMVLTGAGVSTSCGIPDFRSADGIYARLQQETNGELTDPQEMFGKSTRWLFQGGPTEHFRRHRLLSRKVRTARY